jgi:hypothetical protein
MILPRHSPSYGNSSNSLRHCCPSYGDRSEPHEQTVDPSHGDKQWHGSRHIQGYTMSQRLNQEWWAKNGNWMQKAMAKSHTRQLDWNRAQISDKHWDQFMWGEMEPNSQSGNKVRRSWRHTPLDMAGMNKRQTRPAITMQSCSTTEATLAQYRNCNGNDQQGMITMCHLLSYDLVLPRCKIISWITKMESRPPWAHRIHLNDSVWLWQAGLVCRRMKHYLIT